MHRISLRTYVGQPNEVVSLSTDPDAGGQVSATLDGRPIPPNSFNSRHPSIIPVK